MPQMITPLPLAIIACQEGCSVSSQRADRVYAPWKPSKLVLQSKEHA